MKIITNIVLFLSLSLGLPSFSFADSNSNMEQAVVSQINKYRQSRGLSPLKMNAAISQEARKHSQDMANHRVPFGHQHFISRIHHLRTAIKGSNSGAENVAYNYKTVDAVVSGWLRSSGHKRNIDGNYNLTGVGIARDKYGKLYFTQIFLHTGKREHVATRPIFRLFHRA